MPLERFDHFMARANAAYYAARDPFADFTTAPEISQVFGEIIGAWARVAWRMMGEPADIMLVEAGPGRGTLMADALRVWRDVEVHFIETSRRLRGAQAARVPGAIWHDSMAELPDRPMILIGNEFLDALPVRQVIRRAAGWVERHVENGAYLEIPIQEHLPETPPDTVREINVAAQNIIRDVIGRRAIALFIDYGSITGAAGESVQAIWNGAAADPLAHFGEADLTAHVDFAALATTARDCGANVQGPVNQNEFLTALGLFQRTDALARRAPERAASLQAAARRLTAPEAMGILFKVLAVCPAGFGTLPGFAA